MAIWGKDRRFWAAAGGSGNERGIKTETFKGSTVTKAKLRGRNSHIKQGKESLSHFSYHSKLTEGFHKDLINDGFWDLHPVSATPEYSHLFNQK